MPFLSTLYSEPPLVSVKSLSFVLPWIPNLHKLFMVVLQRMDLARLYRFAPIGHEAQDLTMRTVRVKLAINPGSIYSVVSLNLPIEINSIIRPFAALFSKRVWCQAQVLVVGAILATGKRTVTSILGVMGLTQEKHFQNYHRVLNRAVWSSLAASRILIMMLVTIFAPDEQIVMGMDDTIERRRGEKIKAKGIYRDPVYSTHSHFVKVSGLRWLILMLLAEIPWAQRVWALPFLTVLAPSERYNQQHKHRHKTLIDWGRQMMLIRDKFRSYAVEKKGKLQ